MQVSFTPFFDAFPSDPFPTAVAEPPVGIHFFRRDEQGIADCIRGNVRFIKTGGVRAGSDAAVIHDTGGVDRLGAGLAHRHIISRRHSFDNYSG